MSIELIKKLHKELRYIHDDILHILDWKGKPSRKDIKFHLDNYDKLTKEVSELLESEESE